MTCLYMYVGADDCIIITIIVIIVVVVIVIIVVVVIVIRNHKLVLQVVPKVLLNQVVKEVLARLTIWCLSEYLKLLALKKDHKQIHPRRGNLDRPLIIEWLFLCV